MRDVVRIHKPVLQLDLLQVLRPQLNEVTFRDIMNQIDPNFLLQGLRVQQQYILPHDGNTYRGPGYEPRMRGISYQGFREDTMIFFVTHSSEYPERAKPAYYENAVRFMAWDEVGGDPNLTPKEKASLLLWSSDVQLHCDDPSFLYWGYQYILSTMDAAMIPEFRYPKINNPGLEGIVCKHLNRVLHVLPFYNADLMKAVTEQWGGKVDKKALDAIRRRADRQKQENLKNTALPPEQEVPPPEAEQDQALEQDPTQQTLNPRNPNETPPTA